MAYEKKHSVKLQVKYIPIEELQKRWEADPQDVVNYLRLVWATGGGTVGTPTNGLFPDWNPKPVIHYL